MKQKWGKKLKYFLLAPFLFILLVGCNDQNSTDSSEGVKEIEFFNQKPEISRQLEELANTYSEEHEDVNITITTIGSGEGAAGLQEIGRASCRESVGIVVGGV